MNNSSTWYQLIIFCNQYKVNDIILRKDIQRIGMALTTMDIYIYVLRQQHYLKWITRGKYKLLKKIPEFLKTDGVGVHKTDIDILFEKFEEAVIKGENNGKV